VAAPFFAITDLFYARAAASGGQPTHSDAPVCRSIFRLAPLYGVTLTWLVVVAVFSNGALAQFLAGAGA
jgi:hypothetical protein